MKNKIKNLIFPCALLSMLCTLGAHAQTTEPPPFAPTDLDQVIENSAPSVGEVQIFPTKKIRFEAKVSAPPQPRKTHYLLEALQLMGVDPLPEVSQGMDIASSKGHVLNVYMEKKAAERAGRELIAGDKAVLLGYHVYDSKKHGPGILVADFERRKRDWKQWWAWAKSQATNWFY